MSTPDPAVTTTVAPRYAGPPGCGNGGWVCGLLAEQVLAATPASTDEPAVRARLSAPTPVGQPLRWEVEGGSARLLHGETLLGTAGRAPSPELDVPAGVDVETARELAAGFDLAGHPYPGCYVCGPDNEHGLHVYAAEVPGRDGLRAATVTLPEPGLPPVLAALDCPGAWAIGFGGEAMLLGTFVAEVHHEVPVGRELVVLAWPTGVDERKRHCGTALLADGTVLATAAATWVVVDRDRIPGTAPAAS